MNLEPFSLPLQSPLGTATGTIDHREGFLVRVEVDGVEGVGEATPLPGWTEPLSDCKAALEAVTDPVDALDTGELETTPAARHGVSLAVLDARARKEGIPLYRYLGGERETESVPVNATVGDGSPEATASAVETAADADFPAAKIKVGARSLVADLDRLAAVRTRCPTIELRVDANGSWDRDTARRAVPELAGHDVSVVEQPMAPDDLAGHADLRGRDLDIALDESVIECGVDSILEASAADLLVCKPMALGGVDIARGAIIRAREVGLDAIVTTTIDGAVARAAATHLAASVLDVRACGLATGDRLADDFAENATPIRNGAALVPHGKGNIPPL